MFWHSGQLGAVRYAFTDVEADLATDDGRREVEVAFGAGPAATMHQVHGATVADANLADRPTADALVLVAGGPAGIVRVADCTPIVLAAPHEGLAAVVHAGRVGMVAGVVAASVAELRSRGAGDLTAILGPRACGRCYEVPEEMAAEVERAVPGSRSTTSWGTPAIDVGAGVSRQLADLDVAVIDPAKHVCTITDEIFFSYRRQGAASGRFGAIAVVR